MKDKKVDAYIAKSAEFAKPILTHLRERAGLPAIDDPLPGAPNNVFLTIRKLLGGA
jgi:hypothetical protein